MKRTHGHLLRFLVILFIMVVDVSVLVSWQSFSVFASPPTNGDWVVTGTESYYDEVFVLNGNLIVESGGNLTFRKVTLRVNCTYNGQYNLTVMPGGKFYVLEGSVITSENPGKRIGWITVHETSIFRMKNSELHECGGLDPKLSASGLIINSDDAIVENSLFSRNTWGILVGGDGVVRGNNITANDIYGIHVTAVASPIICDNHVSLNGQMGIGAYWSSSPTIYNNTITSNLGPGLEFGTATNPIIQDNVIELNLGEGIIGFRNCSPVIQGNNITSNGGQAGITLEHYCGGVIQGNLLMNNYNGVHSHNHSNPFIQGNVITSNNAAGIRSTDNSLPEVHWNDIYGNTNFGVMNEDILSTVNATYNYWGDGTSTYGNVLYSPMLTESIFSAEIITPLSRETVSSTVKISTKVNARSGLEKVEFYIDNRLENVDYDASYEWNWDTTQCTQTEHRITAKAHDTLGLKISTSITVFVDNTPPTVTIEAPTPQNIYSGTINVNVDATDNQEIVSVHFKVDNTEWLVMIYNLTDLLWEA